MVLPARRAVHLRAADIPEKTAEVLGDGQVLLRFLAAGVCGSDLPGFRGAQGKLPGDAGASAAEMDGFPDPRGRRGGDREPPSGATASAIAWSAGRRVSTA